MIYFVGSNPSIHDNGLDFLGGTRSGKILQTWIDFLKISEFRFTNVSWMKTPKNRPLRKTEYQLNRLEEELKTATRIIALGRTAEKALDCLGITFFVLPHPSPANRLLNDPDFIFVQLAKCKDFINGSER